MSNEFELLYYCHLHDDFSIGWYYHRFERYLWGIIHQCLNDQHEMMMVHDHLEPMVLSLMALYQPIRCVNFKAWFGLCIKRALVRYIASYRKNERHYALDQNQLHEMHHYPLIHAIDYQDPQYMDALRMKLDIFKQTIDHGLSKIQKQALITYINDDLDQIKAKPKLKNGLHHAKSKIYASLKHKH